MALKFSTGRRTAPVWAHVYGPEGVGKTSFAADAPDPVFFDIEQGSNNLATSRVTFDAAGDRTRPLSFAEVLAKFVELRTEAHPYRTIVIDTADALEALIWAHVCHLSQVKSIEDFGYGKGYVIALGPWRQVIDEIEALRGKGYNVITVGHSIVKPFKNPEGEDFDRYIPKLHEKAGALIKERADAVLFARFRDSTRKDAATKRVRGVTDKARVIHTQRTAAFDAKNRFDLPEEMPLSWASFFAAVQAHKPADPGALRTAIAEKIGKLAEGDRAEALGYLEKAGSDAVKLSKLNSWVNAKTPEDGPAASPAANDGAAAANVAVALDPGRAVAAVESRPEPEPVVAEKKPEPAPAAVEAKPEPVAKVVETPKPTAATEAAALTPGVDVPAMESKPAPKPDPKPAPAPAAKPDDPATKARGEILDAADKCKTPADMARLVLPLITKHKARFDAQGIEDLRGWYVQTADTLKAALAKNGAQA